MLGQTFKWYLSITTIFTYFYHAWGNFSDWCMNKWIFSSSIHSCSVASELQPPFPFCSTMVVKVPWWNANQNGRKGVDKTKRWNGQKSKRRLTNNASLALSLPFIANKDGLKSSELLVVGLAFYMACSFSIVLEFDVTSPKRVWEVSFLLVRTHYDDHNQNIAEGFFLRMGTLKGHNQHWKKGFLIA